LVIVYIKKWRRIIKKENPIIKWKDLKGQKQAIFKEKVVSIGV